MFGQITQYRDVNILSAGILGETLQVASDAAEKLCKSHGLQVGRCVLCV